MSDELTLNQISEQQAVPLIPVCQVCMVNPAKYVVSGMRCCEQHALGRSLIMGAPVQPLVVIQAATAEEDKAPPVPEYQGPGFQCGNCEEIYLNSSGEPESLEAMFFDNQEMTGSACCGGDFTLTKDLTYDTVRHNPQDGCYWVSACEHYRTGDVWSCGECGTYFLGEDAEDAAKECCA